MFRLPAVGDGSKDETRSSERKGESFWRGNGPIGEIIDGRFPILEISEYFSRDLDDDIWVDIKIGGRYTIESVVRINFLTRMMRNVCIPFRLLARGNSSTRVIRNVTR